ncbi:YggS family pyridoxal phosphate-dependent enzyme [Fulvivirga kasyanovii]|uniref:Pyridoxal phosphate homeostasis protein n=1 Tax=Fulvivirga kasyanovii TaxID=396812 RepID=A0ABW9RJ64_9BACT|nr:YggS family pyridoxal phosphate-dependent enzyme [Fulvivirga kasyanovii]MTI24058.1 YggS family pyridoxal phosphate-dependent enzyme [Fulvivirga kasyanovii]
MVANTSIKANLHSVLQRINIACLKANRDPNQVKLLLATKTVHPDNIILALNEGQKLIGENKVQEIKQKHDALKNIPHEKHFIGHLQTNKIKDVLKYDVSCIQSLDRLKLAEHLHEGLSRATRKVDVLIQVNTSGEQSKFGIHPAEAIDFIKKVAGFNTLRIKGLMTIGIFSGEENKVRQCFKTLRSIQEEVKSENMHNVWMDELSMGMSSDLEVAIEEGATIIRVGTAIFGIRKYSDSYYWNENES